MDIRTLSLSEEVSLCGTGPLHPGVKRWSACTICTWQVMHVGLGLVARCKFTTAHVWEAYRSWLHKSTSSCHSDLLGTLIATFSPLLWRMFLVRVLKKQISRLENKCNQQTTLPYMHSLIESEPWSLPESWVTVDGFIWEKQRLRYSLFNWGWWILWFSETSAT